jgi:type IV secretion system protein TrbL
MSTALNLARPLFFGLAGLEFAWAAINYTLRKNDLGELITAMTLKILGIAFFAMILTEDQTWIPPIINSFTQAGQTVGGGGATSISSSVGPSEILSTGIDTAAKVVSVADSINNGQTAAGVSIFHPGDSIAAIGTNLLSAIFIGMSGRMILLVYHDIALQLLITTIESYIVIGAGALMIGFSGSRWTLPFAEKYFGYAVSVGIKLFTIYVVAGFGGELGNIIIQHWASVQAASPPNNTVGPIDFMTAGITALAYGAVGYMVPGIAGSMMNGSPSMSLSNAGAAAGGMASAPIAGSLAAGAAGLRAAGLMGKATPSFSGGPAVGGIGGSALGPSGPVGGVSGTSRLEALAAGGGKGAQAGAGSALSAGATSGSMGSPGKASAPSALQAQSGQSEVSARFQPDGKSTNAGTTTGAGDGVKSGAELGKSAAPVTQEAKPPAAAVAVGTTPGGNGFESPQAHQSAAQTESGAGTAQATDAARFQPDGKSTNAGTTTGAGDGVKSGAELGKSAAPVTQEAKPPAAAVAVGTTPGGNGFESPQAHQSAAQTEPGAGTAQATDATQSAAQKAFEQDNAQTKRGPGLADKALDAAQTMQHESNRRKPGLSHDGQSGGVSIRMNHVD